MTSFDQRATTWADNERARLRAQTPEEAILETLRRAITTYESLDPKTNTRIGQDGRPYKVTRFQQGIEYGKIRGLADAVIAIRAGSGYYNGGLDDRLISEITGEVIRELRETAEAQS